MKWQRALLMLTVVNLVILTYNLVEMRAAAQSVPQVLRGRARATLNIQPAANGHSEIVLFRLINERQRPAVKISTSEEGSGLMLSGAASTRETYAVIDSIGTTNQLRLRDEDGREQLIKP